MNGIVGEFIEAKVEETGATRFHRCLQHAYIQLATPDYFETLTQFFNDPLIAFDKKKQVSIVLNNLHKWITSLPRDKKRNLRDLSGEAIEQFLITFPNRRTRNTHRMALRYTFDLLAAHGRENPVLRLQTGERVDRQLPGEILHLGDKAVQVVEDMLSKKYGDWRSGVQKGDREIGALYALAEWTRKKGIFDWYDLLVADSDAYLRTIPGSPLRQKRASHLGKIFAELQTAGVLKALPVPFGAEAAVKQEVLLHPLLNMARHTDKITRSSGQFEKSTRSFIEGCGVSDKTPQQVTALNLFIEWIEGFEKISALTTITTEHLAVYRQIGLNLCDFSSSTQKTYFSHVCQFFKHLHKDGLLPNIAGVVPTQVEMSHELQTRLRIYEFKKRAREKGARLAKDMRPALHHLADFSILDLSFVTFERRLSLARFILHVSSRKGFLKARTPFHPVRDSRQRSGRISSTCVDTCARLGALTQEDGVYLYTAGFANRLKSLVPWAKDFVERHETNMRRYGERLLQSKPQSHRPSEAPRKIEISPKIAA